MLVVDLEMSGLDSERHSIISIGAVDFWNPSRTMYLECRMRPGAEYDPEAGLVHGLSKEYLEQQPLSEQQLVMQFLAWAGQSPVRVIMGMCPWKDLEFLSKACERYKFDWVFGHRAIDLHSVAIAHHFANGVDLPMKDNIIKLGLDPIAQYCGIPPRNRNEPHNALSDAKITAECFSRLLTKKGLFPEYEKFEIPSIKKKFGQMHG